MRKRSSSPPFEDVLRGYISRRNFISGASALGAAAMLAACASRGGGNARSSLRFDELPHTPDGNLSVPSGYRSQVLVRWGDALVEGLAEFDPYRQSAAEQARRFGYNNDFVGFLPLPRSGNTSDHGLLVVNHEFTNTELMFPGSPEGTALTRDQALTDIAAHGLSVVEVKRVGRDWVVDKSSAYNRRVTPDTPMMLTGAAAGSARLTTLISADGVSTRGTFGNCSGGITPWGTVLTAEENVDGYFSGDYQATAEAENYARFGVQRRYKNWGEHFARWNLDHNPRELLHAGWVVEIDPYNPASTPKKRTALGRFKHEGCNVFINRDGRVVAYSGDDQAFEYMYKFVSKNTYQVNERAANLDLLQEGRLFVARFLQEGTVRWLPLEYGVGPLTQENGFHHPADVLLDTRKAADLLGATPMDRPEDIEVNPGNGRVYAMLTNNPARRPDQLDAANPRPHNSHGQIIELWPPDGDHSREEFRWDLFLLAGNPADTLTLYHPHTSERGWLSCPDNCTFDALGNLWIASDGAQAAGIADGLWATEVSGQYRALTKRFMRIPRGAEMCGPCFTPDGENLFCAVQHPAAGSTFAAPSTRWPDFNAAMPPRPAVVVTRKTGGGRVGS